jgi:GNAT superfamily N-acetyltransferase
MNIRNATEADTSRIGEMWEALAAYHHGLDSGLPPAMRGGGAVYARRITARLNDPLSCVLVAEVDGQVVGYVLAVVLDMIPDMFIQENSGFLADIFVDEAYRRRAIGQALVDGVRAWFRSHGVRYYEWYVAENNVTGKQFWQASGGRALMLRMRSEVGED